MDGDIFKPIVYLAYVGMAAILGGALYSLYRLGCFVVGLFS